MKMRELKRTRGAAITKVWPPRDISAWGGKSVQPGAGVLRAVKVVGRRIFITVQDGDLKGTRSVVWDAPPSVATVEKLLRAHIGDSIKQIGELEEPEERAP